MRRWLTLLATAGLALGACGPPKAKPPSPAPAATAPVTQASPTPQAPPASPPASSPEAADDVRDLSVAIKPWKGDFDQMVERRRVRILVPYGRTLYFNDKGTEQGITAEAARDFERYINQKYRKDKRPITVVVIPTTRDRMLAQLAAGIGDIGAGNLTVTEGRLKIVDFVVINEQIPVREVIVTGPNAPALSSTDDLSRKTVAVRRATSYYESLVALNQRFAAKGRPPVVFKLLPDALEDEDKLEMLNAGLFDIVVADDWRARMWAQVLPNIKVREDLILRADSQIGWAIRKSSPQLAAVIKDFNDTILVKQGVTRYRLAKYLKRIKQIQNPTKGADSLRFEEALEFFRQYGSQYKFDPLMLAAQGYQESRLDQNAKSHVGAIGVMQIMPATGKELRVGDIRQTEANIHGGAKYMDQLMTRYFKDAKFDDDNRSLFAFAAYNAGPGRIQKMRTLAEQRGLDPDQWFNNVEIVTAEKVGIETTTYVRNIYKYYVAYRLMLEAEAAKQKAIKQVAPG